jgi:hypothetical protein
VPFQKRRRRRRRRRRRKNKKKFIIDKQVRRGRHVGRFHTFIGHKGP